MAQEISGTANADMQRDDNVYAPSAPPMDPGLAQPTGPSDGAEFYEVGTPPPGAAGAATLSQPAGPAPPEEIAVGLLGRLLGASPSRMVAEPVVENQGSQQEAAASNAATSAQDVLFRRLEAIANTLFNMLNSRMTLLEEDIGHLRRYVIGFDNRTATLEQGYQEVRRQVGDLYNEVGHHNESAVRHASNLE